MQQKTKIITKESRRKSSPVDQRAVLVMGSPRSGTSMTAHVISSLGYYFGDPDDFVSPEEHGHNPIFFELRRLNEINDEIISDMSGGVYGLFNFAFLLEDFTDEIFARWVPACQEMVRTCFGSKAWIGLKDPRFCFTLPIWMRALTGLGYKVEPVLTRRSVVPMAASNSARNLRAIDFSHRLAVHSVLSARYFLKSTDHTIFDYDRALDSPREAAKTLASVVGGSRKVAAAAKVIQPSLRHFQRTNGAADGALEAGGVTDAMAYWPYQVEPDLYRSLAMMIRSLLSDSKDVVGQLQGAVAAKDLYINGLTEAVKAKDWHITKLENLIRQQAERLQTLEVILSQVKGLVSSADLQTP